MKIYEIDYLKKLDNCGYKVIAFKHLPIAFVRMYSKNSHSFWKRHCPIYQVIITDKEKKTWKKLN